MYSNNQQQQHQQQQQNLQPMQTFPKKMAKIKPMISQPSTESAEFIADDQLIKVRTPVRAVWRHKPIVHLLASSKESVSVEQVYISEDSGEPVAVCSADHASNPSPEAEELSVTEGSSFVIHTPSPSSSSSFVFQSQNNTQHAQKSDSKLPVQFYYHNDESESDYIVIHQANMESSQSRPNNEHSHHDETFIEDEECSGDDDLSEDELDEYIVTTSQNAPDDLLLDDEEDFYSSKKNKNSKQMINYFMHDIQQSGDNDQSEYLLTEPEELFENALEENQTKREIVYDFPIFVPPFGYGYLETIFEEDEDNDEIIGAQHDTRYSSSESSDGSNQNAIAESLDDQSFNSDEVFMHDNSCSPEPTVEQFEEKPNLESKKRIKKRNDSGIKSHSSNESFASSHSSTSKVESLNSFTIGPHHQSEEELLSPNEDFGPEARSAHRKLLIGYQQHPQSPESQFFFFNGGPLQTPSSVEHLPEHFHQHLEESSAEAQQFLIPPPSNLGFSGSSTDGDNDQVTVQLANGESSCEHDQRGESPLYSTSSTTTTGCLIAAAEAEINQAAQEVITPSPSISNSTTVTTTSPTPTSNASEQSTTTEQYSSEQYSYPTISMATATLTSAVLGGASPIPGPFLLPGDEYYLQQMYSAGTAQTVPTFSTGQHSTSILLGNTAEQAVPSEYRRKDGSAQRSSRKGGGGGGGHRHRRKGAINLLESGSDQASDIAPLDLSPDGGSTEDVSTGTPSTRSALSSDSEISRSDLSDDSDEETDRGTIRRRVVVDKNNNNNSNSGSNEKMQQQMAAQPSSNSLDRNVGPNFKLKTAKNIWSPSSSSLASPGSPPNAALLNSTENSDLYSDQISVNTQVPTHSTGEEGSGAGHLLSLHFVSSPSNDPQFAHLHHHNHNHYPQHYQHQHQQYSQQLPPQFAQAPLSLADYQAAQQQQGLGHRQQQHHHHPQLNHHSSEVVPPPYSSATYEQFEQKQQAEQQQQQQRHLQQYLAQHPTEPPALFSSSTLPRSMTIMESGGGGAESALHSSVPHVAEVYQPRQHPTHKYWTLPRSIATGIPLPNGGPYIERPGGVPPGMVLSEADDVPISAMAAMDDVDRFNKHHEQLQQTRIKEIAEQHMKPIHSTTTTTTSGTTVQEEIAHGTQTVSTSTTSKHIIQHVVARDEPPHGATLLYETEDATFYTVPAPEGEDELDQGMQATSSTTVKTTTYAVPKKKLDEGIGPVNESGVPITPKAGVKSEHGSEWYKAWVRNMHKMERAGRDDSADSICVKVKSPRYKGTDYQLTVEGKRGPPKYVPGNIADYEPGHSSISEREKQIKNGPELSGQPGTSSQLVAKAPTTTTSYYHEKCVFNTLTGQKQAPASVGSGSGYDSDSSYIIKKSKPKQSTTKPASPAVYRAVQRGEIDIPLGGLQRPAPPKQQPRREMEDYGDLETGENYVNGADEWNQLDEWQSQIETDFDYIYSTLQNVKAPGPSASTPYPLPTQRSSSLNVFSSVSRNVSPRTSTQLKSKTKKTVAFDDADEVQVIEEIEEVDDDIDNSFSISNATNKGIFEEEDDEVEEAEYSYGGLLRPGSHKPEGYAKSFEHYLNTQDLDKNVQRLKSLSGDDRVRVRKHRKRRSRSPGGSKSPLRNTPLPNSVDSDYDRLPPSYYSVRSSSNKTGYGGDSVQRTSSSAVYQPSQLNEGKINVQYRMPTNKLVAVDPMLDITAGSFTSTATGKNSGRYSYSGFMSPASMASTTVADSSFSTVVKQPTPTPRNVVLTSSLGKGPCGSEPYSMARHHYMPTAMSPVALDRYERAFADKENEPKKMARVIYDFHAQSRNELAVKKGDLVIVRKTVSLNWVEVEDSASGLVGLVPRSYLDFEQYGVARARYDFAAKTNVEISFKRGEKLTLLRRVDNNWYEGMNEKQDVGIFPVSYVEAIKQPIETFR